MTRLIDFIFINCTRVAEEPKFHQQSHIRHTHKILTFEYISRTQGWRFGEECSQLFLSFINLHKPVVSSTISGWLKNVLRKAGIDMSKVLSRLIQLDQHLIRGAPIEEILKRGCWSNTSTWQKFYNKNI